MSTVFKQENRLGKLHTDLGKDVLVLMRFTGSDYMNDLFEYRVEALSTEQNINFDELIGTHATVELESQNNGPRFYDGIVTQAQWAGAGDNGNRYNLTLRPWFWLAGQRRNQRIFPKTQKKEGPSMNVVQILEELLGSYSALGNPAMKLKLTKSYPDLEYTVQYRESDLEFACRLMERFGISYHFTHELFAHTMVLTDSVDEHAPLPGKTRDYFGFDGHHQSEEEHFWEWHPERNLTTGAIRLTDYNFKRPTASMEINRAGDALYEQGAIESFDYPGDYPSQTPGKAVVGLRTEQERGQDRRQRAVGDCTSFGAGMTVGLTGDHVPGVKDETYLCLVAHHSYVSDSYGSGGSESDDYSYKGQYVLTPTSAPMVPDRKTDLPIVQGPQTAVVVGDGEIDCDEFGRILVLFHWDLARAYSMRCRVSQNWASKGWGGMVIPRIGMEVVVEFLEGDPDKPLVTGCVYNGRNDPPYALPENKTKSVFKTNTHQGTGFNELSFEDEKDQEMIYMHGQKDQNIEIQNDRSKTIGRDEFNTIGQDRSQTVGRDETMTVEQDQRENVGRDVYYNVGQNQQENYGKDHVHNVGNTHKQDIYGDHLRKVGRDYVETVSGKFKLDVNQSITNNTAKHTLMAFDKFVIKGPGGKITIDAAGITLEAARINLKGMVSMGGSGSAQVPTLQGAANDALPLVEECEKPEE